MRQNLFSDTRTFSLQFDAYKKLPKKRRNLLGHKSQHYIAVMRNKYRNMCMINLTKQKEKKSSVTYNSRVGRSVTPAEGLEEVSLNRKIPVETSF